MNSKAFFSFILVLAFIFFLLSFLSSSSYLQKKLDGSLRLSLELDKSSFERSMIEQNTDFLIEKTIENMVLKKKVTSLEIHSAVNSILLDYFQSVRAFSFFEADFPFLNDYAKLSTAGAVPLIALSDEFKVNVVKLGERLFLVDLSYAGGSSGKMLVFAVFNSPDINQFFLFPFSYSVRKLVVS